MALYTLEVTDPDTTKNFLARYEKTGTVERLDVWVEEKDSQLRPFWAADNQPETFDEFMKAMIKLDPATVIS